MRASLVTTGALAVAATATAAAILITVSSQTRISELSDQVVELEQKVLAVTQPMEALREDLSAIYAELDDLQDGAASEQSADGGGARQPVAEIEARQPSSQLSARPLRRAPAPTYLPPLDYGNDVNRPEPFGVETPKHSNFYSATDEDNQ